jgi:hypothetical protein
VLEEEKKRNPNQSKAIDLGKSDIVTGDDNYDNYW